MHAPAYEHEHEATGFESGKSVILGPENNKLETRRDGNGTDPELEEVQLDLNLINIIRGGIHLQHRRHISTQRFASSCHHKTWERSKKCFLSPVPKFCSLLPEIGVIGEAMKNTVLFRGN